MDEKLGFTVDFDDGKRKYITTSSRDIEELRYALGLNPPKAISLTEIAQNEKDFESFRKAEEIELHKYDPVARDKTINYEFDKNTSVLATATQFLSDAQRELISNYNNPLKSAVDLFDYTTKTLKRPAKGAAIGVIDLLAGAANTGYRKIQEGNAIGGQVDFKNILKQVSDSINDTIGAKLIMDKSDDILGTEFKKATQFTPEKNDLTYEQKEDLKRVRLNAIARAKNNNALFYEKIGMKGIVDKLRADTDNLGGQVGQAAGNVAFVLGLSLITKSPLAASGIFALSEINDKYGDMYENFKKQGYDDDAAFAMAEKYANINAGIQAGIEILGVGAALKALSKTPLFKRVGNKVIDKAIDAVNKFLQKPYIVPLSEGGEEFSQNLVGDYFANKYGGQDKLLKDALMDAGIAAVYGALGGAMFAGVHALTGKIMEERFETARGELILALKKEGLPNELAVSVADQMIEDANKEAAAVSKGEVKEMETALDKFNNQTEFRGEDANNGVTENIKLVESAKKLATDTVEQEKQEAQDNDVKTIMHNEALAQGKTQAQANEIALNASAQAMEMSRATGYKVKPKQFLGQLKQKYFPQEKTVSRETSAYEKNETTQTQSAITDTQGTSEEDLEEAPFRLAPAQQGQKQPINFEKIERLNNRFFGDDKVKLLPEIKTKTGRIAWGKFINGLIEISEGAADAEGTFYHEAVHKALNTFLTKEEKAELINAFAQAISKDQKLKDRYNKYLNILKTEGYKNIESAAVEETVADGFIQYAKDRQGFTGTVRVFFEKLLSAVKKYLSDLGIIENSGGRITDFYGDILSGQYRQGQAQASVEAQPAYMAGQKHVVDLTKNKEASKSDAEKAIVKLLGKELRNNDTGETAKINANQKNKLLSEVAVKKSIANGFTREQHYAAVSVIDKLFENAVLFRSKGDRNEDVNVKAIKRFVAAVKFDENAKEYSYITIKESVEHGNRIYSIELLTKEKLREYGNTLDNEVSASNSNALSRSNDSLSQNANNVNTQMAQALGISEEEAKRQYDEVVEKYTIKEQDNERNRKAAVDNSEALDSRGNNDYIRNNSADSSTRKMAAGWLKAPNGKPTNLTQRQWVMVRTPAFKKWFGDWEAAANAVMPREAQSFEEAKSIAKEQANKNPNNKTINMTANLSNTNIDKMKSAGAKSISARLHAKALANVDILFERALFDIPYAPSGTKRGDNNIKQMHRIGAIMEDAGQYYPVMLTVKEFKEKNEGNKIYSIEAVDIEEAIKKDGRANGNDKSYSPLAVFNNRIQQLLKNVNNTSKVLDENGEPKPMKFKNVFHYDGYGPTGISEFRTRDGHVAPAWSDVSLKNLKDGIFTSPEGDIGLPEDWITDRRLHRHEHAEESFEAVRKAIRSKKGTIKVYRAVPKGIPYNEMRNHDWITFSKGYADQHGLSRFGEGEYKIIEQEVKISDVYTDGNDINEWGYHDGQEKPELLFVNIKNAWRGKIPETFQEVAALRDKGYDGIIDGDKVMIFAENQVKSVDNRGTFDKDNPDIYYQIIGERGARALDEIEEKEIDTRIGLLYAAKELFNKYNNALGGNFEKQINETAKKIRKAKKEAKAGKDSNIFYEKVAEIFQQFAQAMGTNATITLTSLDTEDTFFMPVFEIVIGKKKTHIKTDDLVSRDPKKIATDFYNAIKSLAPAKITDENMLNIKKLTGWEKGGDGLWKYETQDPKLNLDKFYKPVKFEDLPNYIKQIVKQEEINAKEFHYEYLYNIVGGKYAEFLKNIGIPDFAILHAVGDESNLSTLSIKERFMIVATADREEVYKTIIHELQHLIQNQEGFAVGAFAQDEGYKNAAGEVEARNVEKRMNFTDEERRNTLLSLTEDVAEKDKNYIYKILEYDRIRGAGERRLYVNGKIVDYSQLSKGMSVDDKGIIVEGFLTAIKKATEAEYIEDIDVLSLVRMWQMDIGIDYNAMSIEEIKNYLFESLPEELRNIEFEAYIFKDGGDFEANINNQYAAQNEQIQKIIDAVIDYNLVYLNSDRLNPETITMEGVGAILNSLEDRSYSEADYTEKYGDYELQRAVEFLNEIAPNAKIGYMNDIYNRKGSKGNSKEKSVSGDTQAELAEKNEKYSQARQIAGQQGEFDLDQTAKPLYEAKKGDNGAEVVLTNAKSSLSEQKGYALLGDALTGAAQIRSHDDIGYLFKNLESAATENVFVVLMQADGSYSVLYVSSGSTSRSAIDFKHIIAAINEKKPARVCMVHNHPAGTLAASKGDIMVHETLSKNAKLLGFELMDSVIIDTDKGQYATFNESNTQALVGSTQRAPNQTITPKVERFDRTEYFKNSADFEEIKSSGDVAKLLTREKRGLKNKLHIIITSSALKVTKYVIAPDNLTAEELSKIIITEAADNGLNVILAYNNSELYNYDEINQISELLGSAGINLLACEFVKENEEIIEGYDNLAVKSKNAEMAVEEETETTAAAKSGNFENEPIKAFYSKNLKEAAEYFLSSYDDIIASIQNIDEANLTQEAKDLIALYESAKQELGGQELKADFENYLTKNKAANKKFEPLYADMKRVMLSLWEDFKLSDKGWAGLNEEIVNVMEKQLKSEQFDSKLTTEDFKPLVDLLNRIKASDVKIGEADIDKALRLIKELKKRNIKLPDGQKLRKEILRRGIKGDTGNSLLDVGVIADEFSYKTVRRRDKKTGEVKTYQVKTGQIKVYQRGEEGYENAINLDNFVNEDNAADWLGKESGNEDAPQELADIFMKAVRGENVYKYDERELLEEYENIEKRKEEIFAMLGMGENTGKNDIKVLEKQLKVLKAYKLNRKKVLSRQAVKDIEQTIEKIKKEYAPKSKLKQAQKELEKLKQKLDKLESKEFKKLNNIKNYKSVEEIENALEYMLIDISVEAEFSADEQEAYKMAIPDRALKQIKESFVKALKADIGLLKKEANGELAQGEKKASLHQAMRLYGLLSDNPHITPSDIAAIMNKNKINSFADLVKNAEKIFKDISAAIERNYKEYIAERIDNLIKIKDKYKRGGAYFAKFEKRDMDLWKELNRIMDLKQDEAQKELEIIKAKDKETISKDEPSALDRQEILTLALNYKANGRKASAESFYEFYKKLLALIEAMRDGKSIYDTQSAAAVENDIREILAYMEKNPSIALERMYSYLIANFKGATLTAFGDALSNKFDITTEQIRENYFAAQKGEELFRRAGKIYGSERAFAKAHNDGDKKEYTYLTRLQNAIGNLIQVTLSKNNIIYIFTHIPDVSKIDAVENLLNSERDVSDKELLQASGNNKMLLRYMRQYGAQNLLDMWNKLSDADKQMSALYRAMAEETYNEVNKVFVQIYGYDLPRVEGGYFPSKPYSKAFSENFLSGYEPDSSPISKSFVKSRAGGSGVLMREDIDALEVLNRHFKQLANFIHLAPKLQHLQNVLLNQDVERAFSGNVISMAGLQDRLEEMKAVEIKDNIPKFNKVKELLNYILDNFDVLGNVTIKETNQTISVSKSNISDSLKRQRKQLNNKVYAKFKEAFENAVRVGFVEADEKHKDKNLGQEIFIAKIKIGKEIYFVEFKADVPLKDNDKGVLYYKAHKIITREQISELSKLYLNSRAKNNIAFDSKKVNKIKTDRSQEYATLLKFIKDFRNYNANVPYVLQTFNKVVGNLVISNLFSMFQLFKQAFTFGLMSKSMPKGDFIKYFIEGLLSPIDTIKFMWTNSVYLRNRYTNGQMNELLQMGGDYKTYKSAIEMLKKITSFPTRTGDLLANIIGGYAVVKYQMEQGKSKEEAFEIFAKTSSETMGSALTSQKSILQNHVGKNGFAYLLAYGNSGAQISRIIFNALIKMRRGEGKNNIDDILTAVIGGQFIFTFIQQLSLNGVKTLLDTLGIVDIDDDDKDYNLLKRLLYSFTPLAYMFNMIPALDDIVYNLYSAALSKAFDIKDKENYYRGSAAKIPVLGDFIDNIVKRYNDIMSGKFDERFFVSSVGLTTAALFTLNTEGYYKAGKGVVKTITDNSKDILEKIFESGLLAMTMSPYRTAEILGKKYEPVIEPRTKQKRAKVF